jgi:hypothetical protein
MRGSVLKEDGLTGQQSTSAHLGCSPMVELTSAEQAETIKRRRWQLLPTRQLFT